MPSGITGATITTLTNGTNANANDVMASLNSLKSSGVNNDGGTITTDNSGNMTLVGVIVSALLQSSVGIKVNDGATTNGTTAGSCVKYSMFIGQFKAYLFYFNGYRNASGTEQRIALETPFTSRALFLSGNIPANGSPSPWSGGSQVANAVITVTSLSTSGGGTNTFTGIHYYDIGEIATAFDELGLGANQAATATGCLLLIGV